MEKVLQELFLALFWAIPFKQYQNTSTYGTVGVKGASKSSKII